MSKIVQQMWEQVLVFMISTMRVAISSHGWLSVTHVSRAYLFAWGMSAYEFIIRECVRVRGAGDTAGAAGM